MLWRHTNHTSSHTHTPYGYGIFQSHLNIYILWLISADAFYAFVQLFIEEFPMMRAQNIIYHCKLVLSSCQAIRIIVRMYNRMLLFMLLLNWIQKSALCYGEGGGGGGNAMTADMIVVVDVILKLDWSINKSHIINKNQYFQIVFFFLFVVVFMECNHNACWWGYFFGKMPVQQCAAVLVVFSVFYCIELFFCSSLFIYFSMHTSETQREMQSHLIINNP